MTTPDPRKAPPSVAEIAALTARLRHLSPAATEAERAAFQADKAALLARIPKYSNTTDRGRADHVDTITALTEEVEARAAAGGYAKVGPSARTWSVDPATGVPVGPVSETEHRLVRDLIAQERLDGTEPVWMPCTDGGEEIVARVVLAPTDLDDRQIEAAAQVDGLPSDAAHLAACDLPSTQASAGSDVGHVPSLEGVSTTFTPARTCGGEAAATSVEGTPPEGWQTVSAARAADQLVGRGYDADTARAMVTDYLRETSDRIGTPVHKWGLDQGDIDAIDAFAAAHWLPDAARAAAAQAEADTARAAQLREWHADDQTADVAAEATSETDVGATLGTTDETGWSQ